MNMNKSSKIGLAVIGLLLVTLIGQSQNLQFEDDSHDFGDLRKRSTNVSHKFKFKNYGDKPLTIADVKTSCGCTSPDWPKNPIKAGEKGTIKVVFSPGTQDGFFQKNITVKTKQNNVHHLTIEGVVHDRKKEKAMARRELPIKKGSLQFDKNSLDFNNVKNKSIDSTNLIVYNSAQKVIKVSKLRGSPVFSVKNMPIKIQPKSRKTLTVYYRATGRNSAFGDYGSRRANLILVTNDDVKSYKKFSATCQLYPNIEKPEPHKKSPSIKLNRRVMNFGEVSSGFYKKTGVKVTNIGKKPLKILGTDAQMCSCTAPVPDNKKLAPGESTRLDIDFNARNFNGRVKEELKIYSNDPEKPYSTIILKAFVGS